MGSQADNAALDQRLVLFGSRLRAIRMERNIKQAEFGELVGSSANSQLNYEKGKTPPTIDYLYRLAEHGVDIAYLLTGRRIEGGLDFEQSMLIELFEKLSVEARQSLMTLLLELTGRVTTLAAIDQEAKQAKSLLDEGPEHRSS